MPFSAGWRNLDLRRQKIVSTPGVSTALPAC
jgi:hypothetical protein